MFPYLLSSELIERCRAWNELKRWERRELAQQLRRVGLSYGEITTIVPVSKSSLSKWCRDIPLSDNQIARLTEATGRRAARRAVGQKLRERNLARIGALRSEATAEAASLATDPFWVAGAIAYWAEGAKRCNELSFSNSDPALVRLFVDWAGHYLGVGIERFTVRLHLHDGQDETERREFWSEETGIPLDQFRKGFTKPEGSGHRKNVLYNGTALVRVSRSGDLLHRAMGWIDFLAMSVSALR
jgi:hypothetical protein